MGKRLEGRVAIVTGASQGIGEAIAARFAAEGAKVIMCSRRRDAIDAAAARIRQAGGSAEAEALDVSDLEALAAFVNRSAQHHGRLDVLVNNAPVVGYGGIADLTEDAFRANFRVNVDAVFVATREAMKTMTARKRGSIVNISSLNGLLALNGLAGYGAAKAALIHFTRYTAIEGAPANVRANVIAPGVIDTPATAAGFAGPSAAWGEKIAAATPMRRFGRPDEIADVALFLASDESSYVTGVCIPVDGGKSAELYVPGP
ncbi:MAG: SDR family oxidoreductase [Gammaproteobacteria bacterium]|nr:SDR family oxidoreductase [Gammaproteobacteria bacterium]